MTPLRIERHRTGAFTVGRRTFLRGLGGVVLPLPFLEALAPRAHAALRPGGPSRFITWHQPQGTVHAEWVIPAAGQTDTADFRLGRIAEPLAALRSRLVFLRGVDNKVYTVSSGEIGHGRIELTVLTPRPALGGAPNGPSIDYEVHRRIRRPEHRDPLHLGIGPGNWQSHFSPGPKQVIYANNNPRRVLESIVGKAAPTTDPTILRARQLRVVDAVRENFRSFRAQLGSADRERIDQHEMRLGELERLAAGTTRRCAVPTVSTAGDYDTLAPAQIEVAVFALGCNVSPVVDLDWTEGNGPSAPFPSFASAYGGGWHNMIHANPMAAGAVSGYRYMTEHFARLLKRLSETQTGDGRTLLDETLAVSMTDFGDYGNSHIGTNLQVTMAGNLGPGVKTGRALTFADVTSKSGSRWALNNVYTSVLRAFGGDDQSYGHVGSTGHGAVVPGAIPGILS